MFAEDCFLHPGVFGINDKVEFKREWMNWTKNNNIILFKLGRKRGLWWTEWVYSQYLLKNVQEISYVAENAEVACEGKIIWNG